MNDKVSIILDLLEEKLIRKPDNSKLIENIANIYNKRLNHPIHDSPNYMINMIKDKNRFHFYQNIINSIPKSSSVFEIGAGVGSLLFQLIEQDIQTIESCEANSINYNFLKTIIEEKSLSNRVKLYPTKSYDLNIDNDFDKKFDFIIQELYSNNLFAEGILEITKNAKRFLAPKGRIIPGEVKFFALPLKINFENFEQGKHLKFNTLDYYKKRIIPFSINLNIDDRANPIELFHIDLNTNFKMSDKYILEKKDFYKFNSLLLYFEIIDGEFSLSTFDTNKLKTKTHWTPQVYVYDAKETHQLVVQYHRNYLRITN